MAAVDVGSNTVRLLVAEAGGGGPLRVLLRERRITAMGRALRATGGIGEEEFRASVEALRGFRASMDRLGVERCRAVGTAALREAGNCAAFLEAAREAGVEVEVIDAAAEGALSLRGARGTLGASAPPALLMDIGGGSTEFVGGEGADATASLPIGVVVSLGIHRLSDPPLPWEGRNLALYYRERIAAGCAALPRRPWRLLLGTAGTFTTLAALDLRMRRYDPSRIDGHSLPRERLSAWADRLLALTDAQRLALPGMEKGRERYIVPGALQALAALDHFRLGRVVASDAGILEGIVLTMFETQGKPKGESKWKRA